MSKALVNEHSTAQVLPFEEPMDFEDFVVTFEDTRDELEALERQLAVELNLRSGPIRRRLMELDKAGELIENELVRAWHLAYTSYLDWAQQESWEETDFWHVARGADTPPIQEEADPSPPSNGTKQEAASAAFSL